MAHVHAAEKAVVAAADDLDNVEDIMNRGDAAELVLDDGSRFEGWSFGAPVATTGEAVFQTGMVGYPESLTDPSYRGQILVLTYPLIGNYGVPAATEVDENGLPLFFESDRVQISALVVGSYGTDFSHWRAVRSLGDWLKASNVPAIHGVDTRALTKRLRTKGVMLGKIVLKSDPHGGDLPFEDPNRRNLVAEVSIKQPRLFKPTAADPAGGKTVRVVVVDVGLKYNQIRNFTKRGVEVLVVPWDYDFSVEAYDGLFISNGPGDPRICTPTIQHIAKALAGDKPIFGICLGHQLLALAAGAETRKMLFGNRGQNLPCVDQQSGKCFITSQNHGFAVEQDTLPADWEPLFVNANDGSNEGIINTKKPFFSVQFHPEAAPGPRDTENLFARFIDTLLPVPPRVAPTQQVKVSKVLVLGSGGLSIGQAGEFDYSGSQAIKALKEEGIYTVLINPNIATIQTSKGLADKVYFLPVNPEFVRKVIEYERPDGIYCSFGGQTALNVGVQLKDEFEGLGVQVLGTPIDTIILTEDRELFAQAMAEIGEKCAKSASATDMDSAMKAGVYVGFPCIVRAAYALGGLGSGFANDEAELEDLCQRAFAVSPQVLIERSMKGWKEIEYEVVRDCNDNCITVCNMENFDPLGIHTGDSIVVAPSQTLSDDDYNRLRSTAVKVIRRLGVVGECNIQYAVNPDSDDYCIIEVNARLSRSSALASKATGYPLAYVAAKLGLRIPLTEVKNNVTRKTIACFEPSLDYCVVKIPRWDLKKFSRVSKRIASAMKSVGEVMAIGRTFEETIQKAIRAVDNSFQGFEKNDICQASDDALAVPTDQRLFAVANALHSGYTVERIWSLTKIDRWFLNKLKNIVRLDRFLGKHTMADLSPDLLRRAKQLGFADAQVARCVGSTPTAIRKLRTDLRITPFVKQIDTVAAEFPAYTNYLYMTYHGIEHDITFEDHGIMVLGSGVYRIGSSVEFDWCAVRAIRTIRANGYKTIMVNYNPETVSTDYDEADKLYFENITVETVMDIYDIEASKGVVVSMGGQTPNNIALALHRQRVHILGTSPEMIDTAENRYKFSRLLDQIGVNQPQWKELNSLEEAAAFCEDVAYPVLVRPSYVLSGAAMNVVYTRGDLATYLSQAAAVSPEHPVVISKFITEAKEIEMDAVAVKGQLVMHVISEHIENAGVHSGDATLVLPPQDLDEETVAKIVYATKLIANALNVTGPFNIQFIAKAREIKVIECNLRASRSFPFDSKVLGVDLIEMATRAMLGLSVVAYPPTSIHGVAVKVPQFSFSRLSGADPVLGVEMASTGEVACFGKDKYEAYIKALLSTAFKLPKKNILLSIGSFKEKQEIVSSVLKLHAMGYKYVEAFGSDSPSVDGEASVSLDGNKRDHDLMTILSSRQIDLYINLPSMNNYRRPANYMSRGYRTRRERYVHSGTLHLIRLAVDYSIPLITNIKCAKLFIEALSRLDSLPIRTYDFRTSHELATLPGLIEVRAALKKDSSWGMLTSSALAGGFTFVGVEVPALSDATLAAVRQTASTVSCCDYAISLVASADGSFASNIGKLATDRDLYTLRVPAPASTSALSFAALTALVASWPSAGPIVTSARGGDLAALLFVAGLSDRRVHVSQVTSKEDIHLICAAKRKNSGITCDVSLYSLLFTAAHFLPPTATTSDVAALPTDLQLSADDQAALWQNLEAVDVFTAGSASALDDEEAARRLRFAVVYALTAVAAGRLTLADLTTRFHDNPARIFGRPHQAETSVVVELDRAAAKLEQPIWAAPQRDPAYQPTRGYVSRVILRGRTVYLDGRLLASPGQGQLWIRGERDGVQRLTDLSPVTGAGLNGVSAPAAAEKAAVIATAIGASGTVGVAASGAPGAANAGAVPSTVSGFAGPASASMSPLALGTGMSIAPGMAGPSMDAALDIYGSSPPKLLAMGASYTLPATGTSALALLDDAAAGSRAARTSVTSQPLPDGRSTDSANTSAAAGAPSAAAPSQALQTLKRSPSTTSLSFVGKHVLTAKQFVRTELHQLFSVAQQMKMNVERKTLDERLKGKVLCTLFYEPSTRTSASFESAMKRLGGQVLQINTSGSSVVKGETLQDTIRTVAMYSDAIVLRHPGLGSAREAAEVSTVPVINAGDGIGEHPTQALLDVFTIREELGTVNGLVITLCGDLKNGRTVHSLVRLLSHYQVRLNYVATPELRMPRSIVEELAAAGINQSEFENLDDVIGATDVLYVTRVQKERFTDLAEYERVRSFTRVTLTTMTKAKDAMIVMHPLPRVDEIDVAVDVDPRAAYFRQMRYGLYVRMALLSLVLL